ncbi:MAG: phenylalanine--tRNA ligase subunit alpha [bacterium]|nr:phenylalanine--tRNA ligase subunit alpha [bacterium]
MTLNEELYKIEQDAQKALEEAKTTEYLEAFKLEYLSRHGVLSTFLRGIKDASIDEKRTVGSRANTLRAELEQKYESKLSVLNKGSVRKIDVTVPGKRPAQGHLHPLTIVRREIEDIFLSMGFEIADTPEVEEAKFNFDLVNMPKDHPARDLMDTFWLADGRLLRAHTSAGQGRVMTGRKPPLRILIPGRVFRNEATDASHESTFHQFEGMMVDKDISMADLKGVIEVVLKKILNRDDAKLRFRPTYFPFVEPGIETHVSCLFCKSGCATCKYSGWIEILPAGMIHPNVLRNVGIDSTKYRGFAFGGSIDRLAMLRFGISDIRLLWSGDPSFLKQF